MDVGTAVNRLVGKALTMSCTSFNFWVSFLWISCCDKRDALFGGIPDKALLQSIDACINFLTVPPRVEQTRKAKRKGEKPKR